MMVILVFAGCDGQLPDAADTGVDATTVHRGVDSLLVAAKKDKLFQRRHGTRSIEPKAGWCGARILDGERTRPPHVSELDSIPRLIVIRLYRMEVGT